MCYMSFWRAKADNKSVNIDYRRRNSARLHPLTRYHMGRRRGPFCARMLTRRAKDAKR